MLFSTPLFIFFFLPLSLLIYFVLPITLRNGFLAGASLLFYAWGEAGYILILTFSIGLNYVCGILIAKSDSKHSLILAIAVSINLLVLIYFKYAIFLLGSALDLLTPSEGIVSQLETIHLPLGISFFTFQGISYLVDVHRKIVPPQRNLIDLALYIGFFPQLIAGPIIRYHDIAVQLNYRLTRSSDFAYGASRFIIGLGKKLIIANSLAVPADQIFAIPSDDLTFSLAWFGLVCYTLQIYFDFSGYSDMAIGLARMFGFRFLENFNYPYVASSIKDFWRRWHISLSNWFRDYMYISMGGNRVRTWRIYFNLVFVFFICGLWHGASWNFVVWGLLHGFFLVLERLGLGSILGRISPFVAHAYVMLVVMVGWVFFRSENLSHSAGYILALAGQGAETNFEFPIGPLYFNIENLIILILAIVGATPVKRIFANINRQVFRERLKALELPLHESISGIVYLGVVLLMAASYLAAGTYNPFIYFRF